MRFTGKSSSSKEYGNNPTRRYYMDYEGSPSNNYIKGNEERAMAQYLPHEDLNFDFQIQVETARCGLCVCNPNTAMGNWGTGTG